MSEEIELTGSANNTRHALITGITGQDGYYLARLLLGRGERVTGAVREMGTEKARQVAADLPGIELTELDLEKASNLPALLERLNPDRIFHLAGRSSVAETWRDPVAAIQINQTATDSLMDAVLQSVPEAHFVLAGSGDCFDHAAAWEHGIDPSTPFHCTNPYAETKAAAMRSLRERREKHGLRGSIAVLMNHTSPRRPVHFVERKIAYESVQISRGKLDFLTLGSLETRRDWSWAEDVVEGLALLGDYATPDDFLFAFGESHTTRDWVESAFARLNLDMDRHLRIDASQLHAGDRPHTRGNIEKAERLLNWHPRTNLNQMVELLIKHDLAL